LVLLAQLHNGATIVVMTHDLDIDAGMERRLEILDGRLLAIIAND
jgi:ABC-type lipoprotein export system ATPase subunit